LNSKINVKISKYINKYCILFIYFTGFFFVENIYSTEKTKVAYVNLEYLFENSNYKEKLDKELNKQKNKIIEYQKKLVLQTNTLISELNQKEKLLGHDEFTKELSEIQKKIESLNAEKAELENDLTKIEKEYKHMIYDDIITVMEILSEEENVDIILSDNKTIIYGKTSLDLSQRAIEIMNELESRNTPSAK